MPPFIMAHVSTPVWPWAERATYRALLSALLDEFADAPLYADISALTTITKIGYLRELARRQELHAKLLFGSDFPVPMSMWRLRRDLGRDHARIAAEPSWPNRMVHIFRHMGFNEIVLQQAPRVLRMR